jgi:FkbM family methyltransferase
VRRAVGAAARRSGHPELLGVFYPAARRLEEEALAIRAVLTAALGSGGMYVDVGANRGQLLAEAVRVAPQPRHVAFEPIPQLAEELSARFPGVDCRALAIGGREGVASFCHFTRLDGWSGLERNPQISDERGAPVTIEVSVSTLDAQLPHERPAVVKIDVEGAELAVLQGARTLLDRARPLLVLEHVAAAAHLYGSESGEVWRLLADSGYRVFSATGEGPYSCAQFEDAGAAVNWLAVPGEPAADPQRVPRTSS